MRTFTAERSYESAGKVYVFRDMLEDGRFMQCQYKNSASEWVACEEGSEFSAVEPFKEADS